MVILCRGVLVFSAAYYMHKTRIIVGVVRNFYYGGLFFYQGKSLAATGATLSKKLTTPSNAERLQLAKLFPGSRARPGSTFDPIAECVAMPAHKKKKSSGISERATNREVVLMKSFRPFIPIKKYRCNLKVDQRVKTLQFRRAMSPVQVRNVIQRGFSHLGCSSFLYLETLSNSLHVCDNQQLDGAAAIDRRGALYLCEVYNTAYSIIRASSGLLKEGGISPPMGFQRGGIILYPGGEHSIYACTGFYCIYSSNVLCSCTELCHCALLPTYSLTPTYVKTKLICAE